MESTKSTLGLILKTIIQTDMYTDKKLRDRLEISYERGARLKEATHERQAETLTTDRNQSYPVCSHVSLGRSGKSQSLWTNWPRQW